MDEAPRGAAVRRLVQAPLGRARNGPGDAHAARPDMPRRAVVVARRSCSCCRAGSRISADALAATDCPCRWRRRRAGLPRLAAVGRLVDARRRRRSRSRRCSPRRCRRRPSCRLGSFESIVTAPAELMPSGPPRYSQCGVSGQPFFVVQIPPPAGVMYSRQLPRLARVGDRDRRSSGRRRRTCSARTGTSSGTAESRIQRLCSARRSPSPLLSLALRERRPFEARMRPVLPPSRRPRSWCPGTRGWANAASAAPPGPSCSCPGFLELPASDPARCAA